MKVAGKEIKISNPEKELFPKIIKKDIAEYYSKISNLMLPYLRDRALAVKRFPDGIGKEGFYQKNTPEYYPKWIKTSKIKSTNYSVANDEASLVYMANQACIEFHGWLSQVDKPLKPDKMVFDFDPSSEKEFEYVVKGAKTLKKILEKIGLIPYLMTTGSKGVHVVVPLDKKSSFKELKDFSLIISNFIIELNGNKFTTELRKEKRKGKVFIDVNRNARAQLAIIPYSLRAIEKAPVATPIEWKELTKKLNPQKYTIKNIIKREKDPWKDFFKNKGNIEKAKKEFNKKFR